MKHVPNHDKISFKDMTAEERSILTNAWIAVLDIDTAGINWKDSLVQRPEGV